MASTERIVSSYHDVRLVLVALCIWVYTLISYAGFGLSGDVLVVCGGVACCVVCGLFLVSPYLRVLFPVCLTLCSVFLAVCCQGLNLSARDITSSVHVLEQVEGGSTRFWGSVQRSSQISSHRYAVYFHAEKVFAPSLKQPQVLNLPLMFFSSERLEEGTFVKVIGVPESSIFQFRLNSAKVYPLSEPVSSPVKRVKEQVAQYASGTVGAAESALILGLGYGDDSQLPSQNRQEFRVSGLTHLTAVSGANIAFIFVLFYRFLTYFRVSRSYAIFCASMVTFFYAGVVGWEDSVLRAWVMGALGAYTVLRGSIKYPLHLLSLSVIVLLVYSPELAMSVGFSLSVISSGALIVFAPVLVDIFSSYFPLWLSELLAIPLAASLWCAPVLVLMTQTITPYTVLANMLASVCVLPLSVVGLCVLCCSWCQWFWMVDILLQVGWYPAHILVLIARGITRLPFSSIAVPSGSLSVIVVAGVVMVLTGISFCVMLSKEKFFRVSMRK